ncbi:amidohydrolase [Paracoccaceae bacterium Fryx2]|nr:amidohydrolase [Paracoccaceae bacterium Fryx2]
MTNLPVSSFVEARQAAFCDLSDRIWDMPELNFAEVRSAAAHAQMIASEGFRPMSGIAGMPTAVGGEAGDGGPVIVIMGEYDALPGLSQHAGLPEQRELVPGGNGHGCGHNLLGSASLLAAAALKEWLARAGLPGRVRYLGCPAEEGGSAKGFMVRAGCFDDVDAAICWHPGPLTGVTSPLSLACVESEFIFHGRASHASVSPHLGRSALDAVELMNVGVNYLREHMPPGARIHYAITDAGGISPNVVQARAAVRQLVRAPTLPEMWSLNDRVIDVARGAALMTGTTMQMRQISGEANLVGNTVLERLMDAALRRLGPPPFDAEDQTVAAAFAATLDPQDIRAALANFGLTRTPGAALCDQIYAMGSGSRHAIGSTDVGTVSWVVPVVQCRVATCATGTPAHSWQMVAQGRTAAAHKGMILAAKAMAEVAATLFAYPARLAAAQAEHAAFRAENPFRNPVGPDVALNLPAGPPS